MLDSRDERDEDCVITFQTESILEKFLLKFERLHIDCHDHLYIYDGAHATGSFRVSYHPQELHWKDSVNFCTSRAPILVHYLRLFQSFK